MRRSTSGASPGKWAEFLSSPDSDCRSGSDVVLRPRPDLFACRSVSSRPKKWNLTIFVNSRNMMNKSFQNTDKFILNQSGYKDNKHSQNGCVT